MARLDCARAGAWMTAAEARRLDEADAVRLEAHLALCDACRGARGRLESIASLAREAPGDELSAAALERAVGGALRGERRVRRPPTRGAAYVVAGVAVAAALAALVLWPSGAGEGRRPAESPVGEVVAMEETQIRLGHVRVVAEEGSRLTVDRSGTAVTLRDGRVRVSVRPGTSFAVRTERFVANVLGTTFAVTPVGVEVWEGRVRVRSPEGRILADLDPGVRWGLATARVATRDVADEEAARPIGGIDSSAKGRPARARPPRSHTIEDVRRALRDRRTAEAREMIGRLLPEAGGRAAELEMLRADSFRLDRKHEDAVSAYRRVAERYRGSSYAEAALFGAAQIQAERSPGAARRTLVEYQSRYPRGRFQAEVQALLERLTP